MRKNASHIAFLFLHVTGALLILGDMLLPELAVQGSYAITPSRTHLRTTFCIQV